MSTTLIRLCLTLFAISFSGCCLFCGHDHEVAETGDGWMIRRAEEAFGADAWRAADGLKADITVDFGGNRVLEGQMWCDSAAARSRFELNDGTIVVFDGNRCWVAKNGGAGLPRARFHALTWPYFVALPTKIGDPGTSLGMVGMHREFLGESYPTARLTFGADVGDAPDDWYVLYVDPTNGLVAAAYIVTYGNRSGEPEPHAIAYGKPVAVGGARIPSEATFYNWSAELGAHGDPIGQYVLSNLELVDLPPNAFDAPDGAVEDALPPKS